MNHSSRSPVIETGPRLRSLVQKTLHSWCLLLMVSLFTLSPVLALAEKSPLVVTVGSKKIFLADIDNYIRAFTTALEGLRREPEKLELARGSALATLIKAHILIRYGREKGLLKESEVKKMVELSIENQGGEELLRRRIAEFGSDFNAVKSQIDLEVRQGLILSKMTALAEGFNPSEDDLKQAFDNFGAMFGHDERWMIETITLDLPQNLDDVHLVRLRASELIEQARQDPKLFRSWYGDIKQVFGTTGRGGFSGWLERRRMPGPTLRALENLKQPGEISDPSFTPGRITIFRVLGYQEKLEPTYDNVKELVKGKLLESHKRDKLGKIMEGLVEKYGVKVHLQSFKDLEPSI